MQVGRLDEAGHPRNAQRHVHSTVSDPRAAHVDHKRLARRVGTCGPLCARVGLAGRHPDAAERVAAFPQGCAVELRRFAQVVRFRHGSIEAGAEGLDA